MLLLLLLQLAAAPGGNPAATVGLFSYRDYPPEAARNHWQDTVQVELTVGTDGRPSACRVIRSSGYKTLDDTTCNILMTRAHFRPALDANGHPAVETFKSPPITWSLSP